MTTEKRFVVGLMDIRSIRLECKKCHATIGFPPGKWERGIETIRWCANCNNLWLNHMNPAEDALAKLSIAIQVLLNEPEGVGFEMKLEFDDPGESPQSGR